MPIPDSHPFCRLGPRRFSRRSFSAICARGFIIVTLVLLSSGLFADEVALEYKIKAGFLMNFAKYIEWPKNHVATGPIVIGMLRSDPAAPIIQQTLAGKALPSGRPVAIKLLNEVSEVGSCHLVFLSRGQSQRIPDILRRAAGLPIVTVAESDGFLDQGGIINLVLIDEAVRFEINVRIAAQARIEISSRLLSLAAHLQK